MPGDRSSQKPPDDGPTFHHLPHPDVNSEHVASDEDEAPDGMTQIGSSLTSD